jgi:hypothetical protein
MTEQVPDTQPTDDPPLKRLWTTLGAKNKDFTLPYEQFEQEMQDDENLHRLHANLQKREPKFTIDYDTFRDEMRQGQKKSPAPDSGAGSTPVSSPEPFPGFEQDNAEVTAPQGVVPGAPGDVPAEVPTPAAVGPESLMQPDDPARFPQGYGEQQQAINNAQLEAEQATGVLGAIAPREPQLTDQSAAALQAQQQHEAEGQAANAWNEEHGLGGLSDGLGGFYNAVVPGGARALAAAVDYADNLTAATGGQGWTEKILFEAGAKRPSVVVEKLRAFAAKNEGYVSPAARQELSKDWSNPRAWANAIGSGAGSIATIALAGATTGGVGALGVGGAMSLDETGQAADNAGITPKQKLVMQSVLAPVVGLLEEAGLGTFVQNPVTRRLLTRSILEGAAGKLSEKALVKAAAKFAPALVKVTARAGKQAVSEGSTEFLQTAVVEAYKLAFDKGAGNDGRKEGKGSFGTLEQGTAQGVKNALRASATDGAVGAVLGGVMGGGARTQQANVSMNQQNIDTSAQPVQSIDTSAPAFEVPADVAPAEQQAAQQTYPNPVQIQRPDGQVMFSGARVAALSPDGKMARILSQDAQGNPVDTSVPVDYILAEQTAPAEQPTVPADVVTPADAQPTPDAPSQSQANQNNFTPITPDAEPQLTGNERNSAPIAPEPENPIQPATISGPAPAFSTPAENRKAGRFEKDGQVYERPDPLTNRAALGQQAQAEFATGVMQPVQYAIIEARDLQPSHTNGSQNLNHFLPEAQPKNRSAQFDPASEKAISDIAAGPDATRLAQAPNAYAGAPIINERGEAIQGNGRGEGILRHYAQGGETYKQDMVSEAARVGIAPAVTQGFEQPVLVRIARVSDARAQELGNFTAADTESGGQRGLDVRQAAGRMDAPSRSDLTRLLTPTGEATLTETIRSNQDGVLRLLKKKGLANATQLQTLLTSDGRLTPKGVEDITNLYRQLLFVEGDPNLQELYRELPAAAQNGLDRAVASLVSLPKESSILPEVQNAITAVREFVASGVDFQTWAGQRDMFNGSAAPAERYSPLELKIAQTLATEKRPTYIAKLFSEYAAAVKGSAAGLFAATEPLSRAAAITQTFNVAPDGPTNQPQQSQQSGPANGRPTPPPAPGMEGAADNPRPGTQSDAANSRPSTERGTEPALDQLATQEAAARARIADARQRLAARKGSNSGMAFSTALPVPVIDAELRGIITDLIAGHVALGTVRVKQLVARLRADGLSENEATDKQLRALIKNELPAEAKHANAERKARKQPTRTPGQGKTFDRAHASKQTDATRAQLSDEQRTAQVRPRLQNVDEANAYLDRVGLEAGAQALLDGEVDAAPAVLLEAKQEAAKRYGDKARAALDAGKLDEAKQLHAQRIALIGSKVQQTTEIAQALSQLGGFSPDDADSVLDAAVGESVRQTIAATEQEQKAAERLSPQQRKRKGKAIKTTLTESAVIAVRDAVAADATGQTPPSRRQALAGDVQQVKAKRASLFAELKKLTGSVGIVPQQERIAELHVAIFRTYIQEGVLQIKDLVARFRKEGGTLAQDATDDELTARANLALDQQVNEEFASQLAAKIVSAVKPAQPGKMDPARQMVETLLRKVSETLPKTAPKPKDAREALTLALQNRAEYADVFKQSKNLVLEKIDKLAVSDAVKQQMVNDLTDFANQVIGTGYAQVQFNKAVRQAEDVVLPTLDGKTRAQQYNTLATLPEAEYKAAVQAIADHVTAGLEANGVAAKDLAQAVTEEINRRVLTRRRSLRAQQGIYEEGQQPVKAEKPPVPLSARITALLATRATKEQVAARVAPQAVREGMKALGQQMDKVARMHAEGVDNVGRTLADRLVQEAGLSPAQAKTYADAVQQEFAKQVRATRSRQILRRLLPAVTLSQARRRTVLERVEEDINIAPDADTLAELFRKTMDVPTVTAQDAAELKVLAEKVKAAPEGFQKQEAIILLMRRLSQLKNMNWLEVPQSIWYSSILSGPLTHISNFTGNQVETVAELLVSTLHTLAETGSPTLALAPAAGAARAQKRAGSMAAYIFGTGYMSGDAEKFGQNNVLETQDKQMPGILRGLKFVGRALGASDAYTNLTQYEMRIHETVFKHAYQIALAEQRHSGTKLSHAQVVEKAWGLANEELFNTKAQLAVFEAQADKEGFTVPATGSPVERAKAQVKRNVRLGELMQQARAKRNGAVNQDAMNFALTHTFNNAYEGTAGYFAKKIADFTNEFNIKGTRPFSFVVPFTKILSNVQNRRAEWAGLGYIRAIKGGIGLKSVGNGQFYRAYTPEEQEKAFLRSTLGTLGMLGSYALISAGLIRITGAPSGNKDKDRELPPYSIIFKNGFAIGYRNTFMEPMWALLGNLHVYEQKEAKAGRTPDMSKRFVVAAGLTTAHFMAMGPEQGLADFFDGVTSATRNGDRPAEYAARLVGGVAKGAVPYSAALDQSMTFVNQLTDANLTEKQSIDAWNSAFVGFAGNVPGWHGGGQSAIDVWGQPMKADSRRLWAWVPERDAATDAITRLLVDHNAMPERPRVTAPDMQFLNTKTFTVTPLTDAEFKAYMVDRGEFARKSMLTLIGQKDLSKADDKKVQKLSAQVFKAASGFAHFNAIARRAGSQPITPEAYFTRVVSGEAGAMERKLNRQETAVLKAQKKKEK